MRKLDDITRDSIARAILTDMGKANFLLDTYGWCKDYTRTDGRVFGALSVLVCITTDFEILYEDDSMQTYDGIRIENAYYYIPGRGKITKIVEGSAR